MRALVFAILLPACEEGSADAGGGWQIEPVSTDVATSTSIATTEGGDPWVAYARSLGIAVRIRGDDEWIVERGSIPGSEPSLAISFGLAVVAFSTETGIGVSRPPDWTTQSPVVGDASAPALSVSDAGVVHLAFALAGIHEIVETDTGWDSGDVDPDGVGAPASAIVGETAHLAYARADALAVATGSEGAWRIDEAYAGALEGSVGLAIAEDGSRHVTFSAAGEVWYATDATGSWVAEAIGAATSEPHPRISIARATVAQIAFVEAETLHLAERTDDGWTIEPVATEPGLTRPSIAGDSIVYASQSGVSFATRD